MSTSDTLIDELGALVGSTFRSAEYFACVYGSFATQTNTKQSDLDFFVALKDRGAGDFESWRDRTIVFFEKHQLTIDNEVPFENKLLVSYADLERAAHLDAFRNDAEAISIPPIQKTVEFLASQEVRWRLLLNAMTTPHIFIAGCKEDYLIYRHKSEQALRDLADELAPADATIDIKIDCLLTSAKKEVGEMYLGYKRERPAVVRYLAEILSEPE